MDDYDALAIAMANAEKGIESNDAIRAIQGNMQARGKDVVLLIDKDIPRDYPEDDPAAQHLLKHILRTKSVIRVTDEDLLDLVTAVCIVTNGPTVPDDTAENYTRTLNHGETVQLPRKIAMLLKQKRLVVVMGENAPAPKRGPGRPAREIAA